MALAYVAAAFLLTYLVHSTILLGGGWGLAASGLVRTPRGRDALWKVCLVGGVLTAALQTAWPDGTVGRRMWLPAATATRTAPAPPAARVASRPLAAGSAAWASPARSARAAGPAVASAVSGAPASASAPAGASRPTSASDGLTVRVLARAGGADWPAVLLGVWLVVAAALLVRLHLQRRRFRRRLGVRRELREGSLVETLDALRRDAGMRRPVRLAVSAELAGPVAMGLGEICLPERALTALAPAEQRAVLAHELGHLARRDPAWLALAVLVESVFFLQPLNRMARRRGQEAAELVCDDWAVARTGAGLTLAKCLAEVAGWMQGSRPGVPVAGMAEQGSPLVRRVQRLLEGAEPHAGRGVRAAAPAALLALATVAFAAPGVRAPRVATRPAAYRVPEAAAGQQPQGEPHTWATVREGRVIAFRPGFAARISGEGRLGFRRWGRVIALVDDQRVEIDGRAADSDVVAVRDTDRLQIVGGDGRVEWTLAPVRLTAAQEEAWRAAEPPFGEGAGAALAALDAVAADSALPGAAALAGGDTDLAEAAAELSDSVGRITADLAPALAAIGPEVAARVRVDIGRMSPEIARLQDAGVRAGLRIAERVAPRLAGLGATISAQVAEAIGPALARAFGDSAACADSGKRGTAGPER